MQTPATTSAAILRPKAACAYLGCGRSKLHELHETDPTFPRKIRFSARYVGWRKADLDRWLDQKVRQAGGAVSVDDSPLPPKTEGKPCCTSLDVEDVNFIADTASRLVASDQRGR